MIGWADTLAGGDVAITIQVRSLAKPGERRCDRALVDDGHAGRAERVAGWVRGHGRDALGRVQVGGQEEVVFAAREAGAEYRHRPAAGWRCAGRDDEGEAHTLSADGARSLGRGHMRDHGVGVRLVARHQEVAERVVANARYRGVGNQRERQRLGAIGVDLVTTLDLGDGRGRKHVAHTALHKGRAAIGDAGSCVCIAAVE